MKETKIVGQALGPHYDAPSEEEISDSQELHEILAGLSNSVITRNGEYSARRARLVKFIAKQASIAPAATPAGWVSVPKVLRQEMDAVLDTARGRLSNQALWDDVLAAAPTPPDSPSPDQ